MHNRPDYARRIRIIQCWRTQVVGTFPDGNSALMLVCARLRHVAGTQWGNKKYMSMKHLEALGDHPSRHMGTVLCVAPTSPFGGPAR